MSNHIKQILARQASTNSRPRALGGYPPVDYEGVLTRWPPPSRCTPYEILEQSRHGPYDKRRFHELVMVYHPDRWLHRTYHGIPKATRVERYRMIVAANAILSNPIKRRAYDTYGVGWAADGAGAATRGSCEFSGGTRPSSSDGTAGRPRPWQHNGARMNATWEDGEAMRNAEQPGSQRPLLWHNGYFAVMLVLVSALSSMIVFTHVSTRASITAQQRGNVHRSLLTDLQERRKWAAGTDRESLVSAFLLRRTVMADVAGKGV